MPAQVLLQFGSEYSPRLDRAQFAAFVGALCQELGLSFDEAADLLVVLAAVPPDPQDHMAALVSCPVATEVGVGAITVQSWSANEAPQPHSLAPAAAVCWALTRLRTY